MEDTRSLDAIVRALYDTISGPVGELRDWNRLRSLFIPGARLVRHSVGLDGDERMAVQTVEEFIQVAEEYFQKEGFYEEEIARRTETFGHIAHVFSTYEARNELNAVEPLGRGINSIQLYNDGSRWWVVNMLWDDEREGNLIPEEYLP